MGRRDEDIDWVSVRINLYMRSGGKCEFCRDGLNNSAHVHHRKLRSQGGGHEEANLALICVRCHMWAHAHPDTAYEWGWLVRGSFDPAETPIVTGKPWADASR
jgi:5-methylcytosine-specific restriction endonuclease McrA